MLWSRATAPSGWSWVGQRSRWDAVRSLSVRLHGADPGRLAAQRSSHGRGGAGGPARARRARRGAGRTARREANEGAWRVRWPAGAGLGYRFRRAAWTGRRRACRPRAGCSGPRRAAVAEGRAVPGRARHAGDGVCRCGHWPPRDPVGSSWGLAQPAYQVTDLAAVLPAAAVPGAALLRCGLSGSAELRSILPGVARGDAAPGVGATATCGRPRSSGWLDRASVARVAPAEKLRRALSATSGSAAAGPRGWRVRRGWPWSRARACWGR